MIYYHSNIESCLPSDVSEFWIAERYLVSSTIEFWMNDDLGLGRVEACRCKVVGPFTYLSEKDL